MSKIKWFLFIVISLLGASSLVNAASPAGLSAGDTISIWVKGEKELSVERQIGRDGSIMMPLIGSVGVTGMKTNDAARLISQMLEDGFLKDPLVQVTLKSKASGKQSVQQSDAGQMIESTPVKKQETRQILVEVVDAATRNGIGNIAMMLGNRIYQSNRLGQVLLDDAEGQVIVIADGFQTVAGRFEELVKRGNPARILLNKIKLADSITFNVVDAFTRQPLNKVEVLLDDMKIATNNQGAFKINLIKREFGEVALKRKGYRPHRQVVDFKGPEVQTVMMVRDE